MIDADVTLIVWKLTQVLRGWAKPELLKTVCSSPSHHKIRLSFYQYEFERRKYAQDLIAFDKRFAALFSGKVKTSSNDSEGITHAEFLELALSTSSPNLNQGQALMECMSRVFQTFGGFTSGIGIHYAPSSIVRLPRGECVDEVMGGKGAAAIVGISTGGGGGGGDVHRVAKKLVVGQRMPPAVVLRAANYTPTEVQDLLKSDMRFKILIFCGDAGRESQRERLGSLADKLGGKGGFLQSFAPGGDVGTVFDIYSIGYEASLSKIVC